MRFVPVPGTGTFARRWPSPRGRSTAARGGGCEGRWVFSFRSRAHSSAGERPLHTREVPGSIPGAPIPPQDPARACARAKDDLATFICFGERFASGSRRSPPLGQGATSRHVTRVPRPPRACQVSWATTIWRRLQHRYCTAFRPPNAHTSLEPGTTATVESPVNGACTTDHAEPFQCSTSDRDRPNDLTVPTAHASEAAPAAPPASKACP